MNLCHAAVRYWISNYYFVLKVGAIRQHLADIYEREQNWRQAAQVSPNVLNVLFFRSISIEIFIVFQVLVGIPLETGQKQYALDYKLETYLKIARLYLEDEDHVQVKHKLLSGKLDIRIQQID